MVQVAEINDYLKEVVLKDTPIDKPGVLYVRLCEVFPLCVVRNKKQHQQALMVLLKLSEYLQQKKSFHDKRQFLDYMDALGLLVEGYERKHYTAHLKKITGAEILEFLMEQHSLKQVDLAEELGGQSTVSEILSRKRQLNSQQITALSKRFGVSPAVFFS